MTDVEAIRELVGELSDPEIPVLTLDDLGIVRGIEHAADGHVVVTLTPTYSGCPAMDAIRDDVTRALVDAGHDDAEVRMTLTPAWTTDWMSDAGRAKLQAYGIAPPQQPEGAACPRCGSDDTREVSRFGSTPCQAHHVCNACLEPFNRFKVSGAGGEGVK